MAFDLSAYRDAETAVLALKNRRGDPLLGNDGNPVTVELYAPTSAIGRQAIGKAQRQAQRQLAAAMRGDDIGADQAKLDRQQAKIDKDRVEKLVAMTKAFSENFPVEPAEIYGDPTIGYIADQAEEFIGRPANFTKGPSTS